MVVPSVIRHQPIPLKICNDPGFPALHNVYERTDILSSRPGWCNALLHYDYLSGKSPGKLFKETVPGQRLANDHFNTTHYSKKTRYPGSRLINR